MSYYIDIIDTVSNLVQITQEVASGGGIELSWNGGDAKDKLTIVSSELSFNMLDRTAQDAAFIQYYTGNETRFKVKVCNAADDSVIWQGFLLPDLYSEPYKNGALFVNFTATDGLGRLKGKYLPDEYYSREKSVIDILCQCLRLTGLELELYFAPAIENYVVKKWQEIYIDTESFLDKDKKTDAYSVLETLVKDLICVCYQCDNRWYIEGINRRHQRKTTYKTYDYLGNFIATVVFDRLVKQITPLVTPTVSIIAPYNEIFVTHKKTAPGLSKTAAKAVNGGWALVTGVVGEIYPNDWMGNNGYYGRATKPNYETTLYNQYYFDGNAATVWTLDNTKFISLANKLYFSDKDKVKFELTFDILHPETGEKGNEDLWNNVMKYEILFNGSVLFSNFGGVVEDREKLIFSSGGNCKIEIDHIFTDEGLLDIRLYRPIGRPVVNGVLGVKLSSAEISIIDFKEEVAEVNIINDEFTLDVEIELDYADDKTGASKAFRLAKLKEDTSFYNEIEVYIYEGFVFEGENYAVVRLDGAELIKNNLYAVKHGVNDVIVLDVIYNFLGGDRMVVKTLGFYNSGYFTVKKYAVADVVASRAHWSQWTDAFYKIENNSYAKTVANIYRRMFNVAHEKLELTAKNAVKFNDIVPFKYQFLKDFYVLNCTWNLDLNKSELILGRANYKEMDAINPDDSNIPPIVEAGDTIYISDGVTTASLLATAYDPDGEIVSQQWTQTSGTPAATMSAATQLANNLSDLTADSYAFQIQVTDNAGATAVDTIAIIRQKTYTISLDLVEEVVKATGNPRFMKRKYKLNVTPELLPGYSINFSGVFYLYAAAALGRRNKMVPAEAYYNVERNGLFIEGKSIISYDISSSSIKEETIPFLLNYLPGDNIYITLYTGKNGVSSLDHYNHCKIISECRLQTAVIPSGYGTINGLPQNRELKIEKNW